MMSGKGIRLEESGESLVMVLLHCSRLLLQMNYYNCNCVFEMLMACAPAVIKHLDKATDTAVVNLRV